MQGAVFAQDAIVSQTLDNDKNSSLLIKNSLVVVDQNNVQDAASIDTNGAGTRVVLAVPNSGPNRGPDTDDDGIANQNDLDDDNDGIPDVVEGLYDDDNDGFADHYSRDSDGDGTPDGWDLDSDNDGLFDNREAHPDFETIRVLDLAVNGAIDVNGYGEIAVGTNGLADPLETNVDSNELNYRVKDTDGDGTPDFMDTDSDNDGIYDLIEAGGIDTDNDGRIDDFFDADDKGVDDAIQSSSLPVFDTDGDGVADYRMKIPTTILFPIIWKTAIVMGMARWIIVNRIPMVTAPPTVTKSGQTLTVILDSIEGEGDTDNDSIPDRFDLDSDNDGIPDLAEAAKAFNTLLILDNNADGRLDSAIEI